MRFAITPDGGAPAEPMETQVNTTDQAARLSRDLIAAAAIALVDREGQRALSMRRLARELGVATMSLYTYVASRQELLAEIADALYREVDMSAVPGERWDDTMRRSVASYREVALRHPHVYLLVAGDYPLSADLAQRVIAIQSDQGVPLPLIRRISAFLHAFLAGFLVAEIRRASREAAQDTGNQAVAAMTSYTEQTFREDLELVISGAARLAPADADWRTPPGAAASPGPIES